MVNSFIEAYVSELLQADFAIVEKNNFFYVEYLDNKTKFVVLTKRYGANLYKIIISDAKQVNFDEYYKQIETNSNYIESKFNQLNTKKVYNIHLFVGEEYTDGLKNILGKANYIDEDKVCNVFWSINLHKNNFNFNFNKKQPSEIIGLNKLITKVITDLKPKQGLQIKSETVIDFEQVNEKLAQKYYDENRRFTPYLCIIIFFINLFMLTVLNANGGASNTQTLLMFGALYPNMLVNDQAYYRLVTAFFLHVSFMHFFSNMISLYIFGTRVEKYYGRIQFTIIYMVSGIVASLFSLQFTNAVSVGSSGAIFGLIGAVCVRTYMLNKNMDGLSYPIMLLIIIYDIGSGFAYSNVDNFGHFGGLLAGVVLGYFFTRKEKLKSK